jgi:hypothetical protein
MIYNLQFHWQKITYTTPPGLEKASIAHVNYKAPKPLGNVRTRSGQQCSELTQVPKNQERVIIIIVLSKEMKYEVSG